MKNIMLPCDCKLGWDEKELELIMCTTHFNEYLMMERMNATTINVNASHASYVSHPDEITQLILNATKWK